MGGGVMTPKSAPPLWLRLQWGVLGCWLYQWPHNVYSNLIFIKPIFEHYGVGYHFLSLVC